MTFSELCRTIGEFTNSLNFQNAGDALEKEIFHLPREDFTTLLADIGTIPESIAHDSTEEKLYAKVSDIMLARALQELGLKSAVLKERANSADVFAESRHHNYSLVGDAKAFRLSRTAKNQKDFKVESMDHWRGSNDYAVLVCPYFQYPKTKSQIYGQALDRNVSLFSWEYFYILIKNDIVETPEKNIAILWNQSNFISVTTSVAQKNNCFLDIQNKNICDFMGISNVSFTEFMKSFKQALMRRGDAEMQYWQNKIAEIKTYTKDKAIHELIKSLKLNEKISAISKFTSLLGEQL